ncbi:MAG: right-handed parallel beta-helix repeat-containing protein [Dehalococcoidia bacterium]
MRLWICALLITLIGLLAFGAVTPASTALAAACTANASPGNVQQKINNASSGAVICLGAGTYDVRLFVNGKSNLTLRGAGWNSTIVRDGPTNNTCLLVRDSHNIRFERMEARACHVQAAFVADSTNVVFSAIEANNGPIGFQYRNSTGTIIGSQAHGQNKPNGAGFGAIIQQSSNVQIQDSTFEDIRGFGILSQFNSRLHVGNTNVWDNRDGGVFTIHKTGKTTIGGSRISRNKQNVFAGEPGCAPLPAGNPNPPQCYLNNPGKYYSQIEVSIQNSTIGGARSAGVVIFPGVHATLRNNAIQNSHLTGLFAWGAVVDAAGDDYVHNRENAAECRAYPAPATGYRGMCKLVGEHMHHSTPLSGGQLGGGFVSEGAKVKLLNSKIENNWGIGVALLHNATGEVRNNVIRYNGGSGLCIKNAGPISISGNSIYGNRPGYCLGHP